MACGTMCGVWISTSPWALGNKVATMCFRIKTILGVAIIEGILLVLLVWSSMDYLTRSNQDELIKHAVTTAKLFAAMAKNPVLATDLATLDTVVREMLSSPGVVYVRVFDTERALTEGGEAQALARPFQRDLRFEQSEDGIFDISAEINEGDYVFGRVELGLSVASLNTMVQDARNRLLSIAAIEMVLVAVFSFFLGTYLTRSMSRLTEASEAIANGELGVQVEVDKCAEFKATAEAFNSMSSRLQASHHEMLSSLAQSRALTEKLSQSEQRLTTTLETAVDGFITIDQQGVIQSVNRAGERTFGYEQGELIGNNIACLMPAPYQKEHDGYLKNYLSTGDAKVMGIGREVVGLRKDGSEFPIDLSVSKMRIGDDIMFVGLVRDISERKRMEQQVHRNEAVNNAIVKASLDSLITIDRDGLIVEFSPVAERTFGYTRQEVLGRAIADVIIPPTLRMKHVEGLKRYLATGKGPVLRQRIEVTALRRSGEEFPVELAVSPIEVAGEVLFTAFIRDISEQKAAELQLLDAKRQAEVASEAKSRFLAHMSHEIRSPLNAVLGSVGLLMETPLDDKQHLYAHTAENSGKALLGLINDVLDFSKIEAGQLQLDHIKFNLRDLVAGVGEAVAYRAHDKGALEIVSTLGCGIPAQLMGDPGRLRQILLNFMDNAVKFTERGAVVLRVSAIDRESEQPRLLFEVEDTGIGIGEAAQQRLFSEFSQVDNSDSTRYGGTGLGLAICRQLVELMGGRIGLDSEPGRGSRFWFDVPIEIADAELGEAVAESFDRRVLIVGFSPLTREALRDQWRVLGCAVEVAVSGQQGLDSVRQRRDQPFDNILVDGNLADIEMELLVQRMRGEGNSQLILVANATPLEGDRQAEQWGFDRVIFRPLHLDALLTGMREPCRDAQGQPCAVDESVMAGAGLTLLLAEDSPANQMVATALLRGAGYQVDVANNGREAVDAARRGGYDLILMDMRMPEMDGIEATEIIRAQAVGGDIPILAMSANALQSDIDRCLAAGMNDYVTKPVNKENLLKAIHRNLRERPQETTKASDVMLDNSLPLMAEEALDRLAADTSPEQVPAMVAIFLEEAQMRIDHIREGMRELALDQLREETHVLKSLAGTFGATRTQTVARDLEQACRDAQPEQVRLLGTALLSVFDETVAVYQARMTKN